MTETPILILSASAQPFLSIARFSGGMTFNGAKYTFDYKNDCLLRNDYLKEFSKQMREGKSFDDFIEYVRKVQESGNPRIEK